MNTRILRRSLIAAGLVVAGLIATPAAFARTHVSIGLGFYSPGVSVGYYDGYYPTYYAPAPAYYYGPPAPAYYDPYPAYGSVYIGGYYDGGYYHHWHDRDDWRWRDHDRGWHDHDGYRGQGGYYHH